MADVKRKIELDVSVKGTKSLKEAKSAIDALLKTYGSYATKLKELSKAQASFSTKALVSRIKEQQHAIQMENRSLDAQARAYQRIAKAREKLGEIDAKTTPQKKNVYETKDWEKTRYEKLFKNPKEIFEKDHKKVFGHGKSFGETPENAERYNKEFSEYQSRAKAIRSIQPTDLRGLLSELVPSNLFKNLSQQYAKKSLESQKRIREFEKQYKSLEGKTDAKSLAKQEELRRSISSEQISAMQSEKKAGDFAAAKVIISSVWKTAKGLFDSFNQNFKNVMGFSLSIKENFADVMENVRKITDMYTGMATYATGSSLVMNATARETQMKYGLSASAAYGFDQAKSLLGIQSDTDLMYMNAEQRQLFAGYMERQQQMYNQLESSGVLRNIQELQLEFKMFKQQLAIDFLTWFAKNRDSLMALFTKLLNVTEWILDKLTGVFTFFGGGDTGFTTTSDKMTSVSNVKRYNINISQNNKLEGLADQNAMESYLKGTIDDLMKQAATAIGEG